MKRIGNLLTVSTIAALLPCRHGEDRPLTKLGPFQLIRPIARGGMGRVWLAKHRESGVPVAVKVLHGHASSDPNVLESFRGEVRAAAALDHPGIVMLLDHGQIPAEVANEDFIPGNPWLAMELASGGTLSPLRGALPWHTLRAMLLSILEALAHAHSRGVIHRDLKPSNILIATHEDLRPGLKLTDLGIAHALETERTGPQESMILGTPMFMAPEQVRGEWRDHGPWTDLYALGCVSYVLASGKTPFPRDRPGHAIMIDQLRTEPRPFEPTNPVPEGFASWLRILMEKDRHHRFESAADATAALRALPEVRHPGTPCIAPFPTTWRRASPAPPSMHLIGAGLSLYGLRAIPMIGRESQRDRLWGALEAVQATGAARMVVIRGAAGSGKSHLARWLCERASELGAAEVTLARFSPELQPGQGIRDLGHRYLRTHDMDRADLSARVMGWVRAHGGSVDEAGVLTELLSPATSTEVGAMRLTRPSEYHAGVTQVLRRVARRRPLIVWLDDVHWGLHGLGLARHLLITADEHPFPVLVVATVRDDALVDRPDEARRLGRLLTDTRTETIDLEPLPATQHQRFVEELLNLDAAVAGQVAERTAGNPLFAVQLVGDWVQQGLLEAGPEGFMLVPGTHPVLPDSLHEVWGSRLERVLAEFDEETRAGLELAAALGQEVLAAEWHQAVDDPQGFFGDRFPGGRQLRNRLVERLFEDRLATGTLERWSFVHGMLKETLERGAREQGRWRAHNLAAATMLLARHPDRLTMPAERLGRHLLHAGQHDAAIQPLLGGIEQRLISAGAAPALTLLDLTTRAMLDMGLPEIDKRWGRTWTLTARIHLERGDLSLAKRFNLRALEASRLHGWRGVELYALHGEATRHLSAGALDRAERALQSLLTAATLASSPTQVGRAHLGCGRLALRRDDPGTAIRELELAILELAGDPVSMAEARLELARATARSGEPAIATYELAIKALTFLGLGRTTADACSELAHLLLIADPTRARTLLETAAARHDSLGARLRATVCRLSLCGLPGPAPIEELRGDLRQLESTHRISASVALTTLEHALCNEWSAIGESLQDDEGDWTHPWTQSLLRSAARRCAHAGRADLEAALIRRAS